MAYLFYWLLCGLNAGLVSSVGLEPKDAKYWIWIMIPVTCFLLGCYIGGHS